MEKGVPLEYNYNIPGFRTVRAPQTQDEMNTRRLISGDSHNVASVFSCLWEMDFCFVDTFRHTAGQPTSRTARGPRNHRLGGFPAAALINYVGLEYTEQPSLATENLTA